MNRKARALPDTMIPSAAPALAFLLYVLLVVPYNKQLNNPTVRSLRGNLKFRPTVLTSLSLGQYGKPLVWDFPVTTSLPVIK